VGGLLLITNAIRVLAGLSVLPAPTTPVKFPNSTTIPPSEEDLNRLKFILLNLLVMVFMLLKTLREIIVEWASNGIVVPVRENVDKEFIKALAKPLKITPGYDTTSPNYEVSLDLLALSLGYQPSSCPSLTNYTCTGDRWSRFTIPSNSL
jgi:hypothetical protein